MYIDLAILVIAIILVIIFFKRFDSVVFFIAIMDIILRILFFIRTNIIIKGLEDVIDQFLPSSVPGLIDRYTKGIPNIILKWIFLIIMCIFLFYVIKIFVKKKKI